MFILINNFTFYKLCFIYISRKCIKKHTDIQNSIAKMFEALIKIHRKIIIEIKSSYTN